MTWTLAVDPLVTEAAVLAGEIGDWASWLSEDEDGRLVEALRRHTSTGRPLGGERLLSLLERFLGHSVRPGKPGRPRKTTARRQ